MSDVTLLLEPLVVDKKTAAAMLRGMSVSTLEALGRTEPLLRPVELSDRLVGYSVENLRTWVRTRPPSSQLPPVNCQLGQNGRRRKAATSA
jgi:hypothetical protein